MKVVRTVTGDIAPDDLGMTQTHEHLRCDQRLCRSANGFPSKIDSDGPDRRRSGRRRRRRFLRRRRAGDGGDDCDGLGSRRRGAARNFAPHRPSCRRDVGLLRRGLHAGIRPDRSVEELTEFLLKELTEGADGTDIRTGILKSGVGRPVIEEVELRCAQAVARAH